jgi:hypothetical protein
VGISSIRLRKPVVRPQHQSTAIRLSDHLLGVGAAASPRHRFRGYLQKIMVAWSIGSRCLGFHDRA